MKETIINRKIIIEKLSTSFSISRVLSEKIIDDIFDNIKKAVDRGDTVSISGFGIFRKKVRKARRCRNPRTGEEVMVGDINIVKFAPATAFKELVK